MKWKEQWDKKIEQTLDSGKWGEGFESKSLGNIEGVLNRKVGDELGEFDEESLLGRSKFSSQMLDTHSYGIQC